MLDVEALRPGTCDTVVYCHAHSLLFTRLPPSLSHDGYCGFRPHFRLFASSPFVLRLYCVVTKARCVARWSL
jgi:hypothetical protein